MVIPAANKAAVLQRWKDLNKPENNHLKRAGSSTGERWYAWMHPEYHIICHSCEDILKMLGFEFELEKDGSITIDSYHNKSGQEELFFKAVADLVRGRIDWVDESGKHWTWICNGSKEMQVIETIMQ